jgi:large subunit ribosomal protein L15
MVVKRSKKSNKHKGSRTHGWGLVHRGSGQKGGAGNAGTGKKANSKAPQAKGALWTKQLMGKHGFIHRGPVQDSSSINLRDLEDRLPRLLADKHATETSGVITIDLSKLGYAKVLSTGAVRRKWKITAEQASPGAIEKVKAAGGDLVIGKASAKAAPAAKAAAKPAAKA